MLKSGAELKKFGDLIKDVHVAMLTSKSRDGVLTSRPLALPRLELDGNLWFFVRGPNGVLDDIRVHPQVSIVFCQPNARLYVAAVGCARSVHDGAKIKELWDTAYLDFFPSGFGDPDLALIAITVEKTESWELPGGGGTKVMPATLGFNRAVITGRALAIAKEGLEPRPEPTPADEATRPEEQGGGRTAGRNLLH